MLNIYCIKDSVAGTFFNQMVTNKADALMVRDVKEMVKSGQIRYAEDMQLFKVGTFDLDTGDIVSKVEHICNLADFVEVK